MTAAPSSNWRRAGVRARWASDPAASRGRWIEEAPSVRRTPFERDRDRIIHSTAFRRLKGKTQVFLADEGDHFRTRLTHTLEVAQIARSLARSLGLDEDLAEAIALAHDLGHPPFGHSGERALDRAARAFGGFDHNVQSLRVVAALERRYPSFDGLNLSYEVIEGLVKHNGPAAADVVVSPTVAALSARHDLELALYPALEAQCAAIADDVAYNTHDIDDGLRAGLLTIDGLREVPILDAILDGIARDHGGLERSRLVPELLRRLIHLLVEDILAESGRRIAMAAPADAGEVRHAGRALIGFSPEIAEAERAVKQHLSRNVYRDAGVLTVTVAAEAVVTALFERYRIDPEALPPEWRTGLDDAADERRGRRIADFLAGMTDRFALSEYRRLFDRTPDFG